MDPMDPMDPMDVVSVVLENFAPLRQSCSVCLMLFEASDVAAVLPCRSCPASLGGWFGKFGFPG